MKLSIKIAIPIIGLALIMSVLGEGARRQQLPDGEGRDVFANKCGSCHGLEAAMSPRRSRDSWIDLVNDMASAGALLSKDDTASIVNYLSRNFGTVNVNKAPASEIESVLGVSAKDAGAIVAYRAEHGPFKTVDDLKKVSGLDAKLLDEKKDGISF